MLKQGLHQKMLQKMSPQQIQLMKLLMIPTATLEQRIKEELEANPALEEGAEEAENELKETDEDEQEEIEEEIEEEEDSVIKEEKEKDATADDDTSMEDYLDPDDVADYKVRDSNYSKDDEEKTSPVVMQRNFNDYLEEQLGMLELNEHEQEIAMHILGAIDDDGYMRRPVDAMVDDMAFTQNIETSEEEVARILDKVKQLDPPGVAARDLQECLLLQLHRKKDHSRVNKMAILVLEKYFEEFVRKHYDQLQAELGVTDEMFKKVMDTIMHLNPKPGGAYEGSSANENYVTPDFFMINQDGGLELSLNARNLPELKVSNAFREMLKDYEKGGKKDKKQQEAAMFIKQKIDGAKWFIDAIRTRYDTMYRTMLTIMEHQRDYFLTGDELDLKPMILKDIADKTGLDISTISRVANSKYVQTEFGTFKLKSFFNEAMKTDSGEKVSSLEVKKILRNLVEGENKRSPLTDDELCDGLNDKGYRIARRTVAKYREMLDIPIARLRKKV